MYCLFIRKNNKIEDLFSNQPTVSNKRKMNTQYSTQQTNVMNALRELYEAEGVKGLREMKKLHTDFINKCVFLEKEGDMLEKKKTFENKTKKVAFGYLKRFAREGRWAQKKAQKAEKAEKVVVKRGRPVDQEKRDNKKKEKLLKRMVRVAEANNRSVKQSFKLMKQNMRKDIADAKKADKATKPKGKPGRKKKTLKVVDTQDEGVDLITALLSQVEPEPEPINLDVD